MSALPQLLQSSSLTLCPPDAAEPLAQRLGAALGQSVYPRSIVANGGWVYCMARSDAGKCLCILGQAPAHGWQGERRQVQVESLALDAVIADLDSDGAGRVRQALPFTAPGVIGLHRSLGTGDRLGLATPGHVRSVRGTGVVPVFAQQSIREMSRTERTPQQVIDSATWGVLQEGWTETWGADADHLKTVEDVQACAAAGFTMFTIDPGDHVNDEADSTPAEELTQRFQDLPWAGLESSAEACCRHYLSHAWTVADGLTLRLSSIALFRAAVKYGRAVAHTVRMYRRLTEALAGRPFELEVSVDETATPTRVEEHFYVANELRRLGVEWVSLAPRFVGEFEKGVDYQGSLADFEAAFVEHLAVAKHFGPYKVSLHSGSDKFSVYPIAAKHAGELVHVKTAGTSYLEALRTLAVVEPDLMREILDFSRSRYEDDRRSYHVSGDLSKVPASADLADDQLAGVLDTFDGRQVLHVAYGSVLTAEVDGVQRFKPRILAALAANEETHYDILERHLRRHAAPFATRSDSH